MLEEFEKWWKTRRVIYNKEDHKETWLACINHCLSLFENDEGMDSEIRTEIIRRIKENS